MSDIKLITARGFTLIELAMVLFIIGLLLGGLLVPLATQIEQRDRRAVQNELDTIKQALLGYAVIHGRLPCPSVEANPDAASYGMPVASGQSECGEEGILPWKALGVPETDPWGAARNAIGDDWDGYWRYRVDELFTDSDNFDNPFGNNQAFDPDNSGSDELVVYRDADQDGVYDDGDDPKLTAGPPETPIVIVYSSGPDGIPNGGNADSALGIGSSPSDPNYEGGIPHSGFDDIVVWMTRPILLSTMLSARVLP